LNLLELKCTQIEQSEYPYPAIEKLKNGKNLSSPRPGIIITSAIKYCNPFTTPDQVRYDKLPPGYRDKEAQLWKGSDMTDSERF